VKPIPTHAPLIAPITGLRKPAIHEKRWRKSARVSLVPATSPDTACTAEVVPSATRLSAPMSAPAQ
jgi:hypothetical protein